MLLPDASGPNPEWTQPPPGPSDDLLRVELFPHLLTTDGPGGGYPTLLDKVDRGYFDPKWKSFPRLISIHGDQDLDAPYVLGLKTHKTIGMPDCLQYKS